jgi:hypothetical protein
MVQTRISLLHRIRCEHDTAISCAFQPVTSQKLARQDARGPVDSPSQPSADFPRLGAILGSDLRARDGFLLQPSFYRMPPHLLAFGDPQPVPPKLAEDIRWIISSQ